MSKIVGNLRTHSEYRLQVAVIGSVELIPSVYDPIRCIIRTVLDLQNFTSSLSARDEKAVFKTWPVRRQFYTCGRKNQQKYSDLYGNVNDTTFKK